MWPVRYPRTLLHVFERLVSSFDIYTPVVLLMAVRMNNILYLFGIVGNGKEGGKMRVVG